jgi:hypothetical protein
VFEGLDGCGGSACGADFDCDNVVKGVVDPFVGGDRDLAELFPLFFLADVSLFVTRCNCSTMDGSFFIVSKISKFAA